MKLNMEHSYTNLANHTRWFIFDVRLDVYSLEQDKRQERCGKNSFSWSHGWLTVSKGKVIFTIRATRQTDNRQQAGREGIKSTDRQNWRKGSRLRQLSNIWEKVSTSCPLCIQYSGWGAAVQTSDWDRWGGESAVTTGGQVQNGKSRWQSSTTSWILQTHLIWPYTVVMADVLANIADLHIHTYPGDFSQMTIYLESCLGQPDECKSNIHHPSSSVFTNSWKIYLAAKCSTMFKS